MTKNQYEHHAEQMGAARREFLENNPNLDPKDEQADWLNFLENKFGKIKHDKNRKS
jgi:hypothetical protein